MYPLPHPPPPHPTPKLTQHLLQGVADVPPPLPSPKQHQRLTHLLPLEGVADGDVPLCGEAQHQQRPEVLGGQEDDGEQLADDGRVERLQAPHHVELEYHVQRQEDEVVQSQRRQVAPRGVTHALLHPDDEGKDVAGEADAVDEDGHVLVHADDLRLDGVEQVHAIREDAEVVGRRAADVGCRHHVVARAARDVIHAAVVLRGEVVDASVDGDGGRCGGGHGDEKAEGDDCCGEGRDGGRAGAGPRCLHCTHLWTHTHQACTE